MASLKRLSSSSFLHILILLVCADVVLSVYLPKTNLLWYQRSINGSNEPFCRKIFEYICSNKDPQIVMMGSSLLAVPSISCDQAYVRAGQPYHSVPDMFAFSHYKRSEYFKMLLSDKLGKKVDVVNLGMAGTVASDQLLILQKALAFNKKPSVIICTVAPAEFIWNDGCGLDKTRISLAFKSYTWPADNGSLALTADHLRRELAWHFELLENELASCKTPMGEYCNKWMHRSDNKSDNKDQIAAHLAAPASVPAPLSSASHLGAPASLPAPSKDESVAVASKMDAYGRTNRLEDLAGFRANYAKVDTALFNKQLDHFSQLLDLCNQRDIPIVIVNMPLTRYNKELIDKPVYNKYFSAVTEITHNHRIPFIDMDQSTLFTLSDFYDSTHLNEVGGKKLFVALAERISKMGNTSAKRLSALDL
jgi:hypothetical protein